jgi:hypothetical protein
MGYRRRLSSRFIERVWIATIHEGGRLSIQSWHLIILQQTAGLAASLEKASPFLRISSQNQSDNKNGQDQKGRKNRMIAIFSFALPGLLLM